MKIEINPIQANEVEICAKMMVNNAPWKTFGRTIEEATYNFSAPEHTCYVMRINGRIEGFLVLILNGFLGGGFIKSIMVSGDFQGIGLGGQLLDFAEQAIFEKFANAYICVSSFNDGAKKLYLKRGFKVIANLEQLIVAEHDELLLRKTLGPASLYKPT